MKFEQRQKDFIEGEKTNDRMREQEGEKLGAVSRQDRHSQASSSWPGGERRRTTRRKRWSMISMLRGRKKDSMRMKKAGDPAFITDQVHTRRKNGFLFSTQ